ncbi:MAG TPA: MMPL family transporter [Opitutaceae bacterium]|nr:MMPL family transporter [Opitutaceae bacterium]
MVSALLGLVDFSRRRALAVSATIFVLALAAGFYVAHHIAIDSDTGKLVDPNLPWQKASDDLDKQFPQNQHLLVVVVDAKSATQSSDAADTIARALEQQPKVFQYVRRPDAVPYFKRYGLLLLPEKEVQDFADHLISAQPFLGTLAADPSVRGVLNSINLLSLGVIHGEVKPAQIDPTLDALSVAVEAAAAGKQQPLAWDEMFSGRKDSEEDLRHFVLARVALDFGQVGSASHAIAAIKQIARDAGLTESNGVTVRITGPVALNNDQLSALSESAGLSTVLCLGFLLFWLIVGLRSLKATVAVFVTLLVGLVACALFAVVVIGPFNPVSIAFAPLFIGIAIDFGIQLSVRFSAERLSADAIQAFRATAIGVGPPLTVAAIATTVGFLAFAPTAYLGVRDLGLIAGAGMLIALFLNLTLLPALLALLKVRGRKELAGFAWGVAADRFLLRRRKLVLTIAALLAVLAAIALPRLRFDFNPVNLQNQHSESVKTLNDLIADPNTSPYSIEFLAPPAEAKAAAEKLKTFPEVGRVLSLGVFIPENQEAKLAILQDAALLLSPTLSPPTVKPPPTAAEALAAVKACAEGMDQVAALGDKSAGRLAAALREILQKGDAAIPALAANLSAGMDQRIGDLREILQVGPVSLETLPQDFLRDWQAPDGRWRVQVFPSADVRRSENLRHFAQVVRSVVPQSVGSAVAVDEWTKLAPKAFATAGVLALVTISFLLVVVLRRIRDVALVLVPLMLAGLFTLGAAAVFGFSINFANIITLPMILGIGVAFDIYFVMRRRANEAGLLSSPTARGVIVSALTTGTSFGSLMISQSPGMAEMGKFLGLALAFILLCTIFVLPALYVSTTEGPSSATKNSRNPAGASTD